MGRAEDPAMDAEGAEPAYDRVAAKIDRLNPAWRQPVVFPGWRSVLQLESLDGQAGVRFLRAIIAFLGHCRGIREPPFISGGEELARGRRRARQMRLAACRT